MHLPIKIKKKFFFYCKLNELKTVTMFIKFIKYNTTMYKISTLHLYHINFLKEM